MNIIEQLKKIKNLTREDLEYQPRGLIIENAMHIAEINRLNEYIDKLHGERIEENEK